jgi:hypothetical protein
VEMPFDYCGGRRGISSFQSSPLSFLRPTLREVDVEVLTEPWTSELGQTSERADGWTQRASFLLDQCASAVGIFPNCGIFLCGVEYIQMVCAMLAETVPEQQL